MIALSPHEDFGNLDSSYKVSSFKGMHTSRGTDMLDMLLKRDGEVVEVECMIIHCLSAKQYSVPCVRM